ncbi:MAG: SpoIIE family protein phosphatase [Firmicutes bacterium]|nr:SpoIIE family protein phosphatase [Bacillota bacterium]
MASESAPYRRLRALRMDERAPASSLGPGPGNRRAAADVRRWVTFPVTGTGALWLIGAFLLGRVLWWGEMHPFLPMAVIAATAWRPGGQVFWAWFGALLGVASQHAQQPVLLLSYGTAALAAHLLAGFLHRRQLFAGSALGLATAGAAAYWLVRLAWLVGQGAVPMLVLDAGGEALLSLLGGYALLVIWTETAGTGSGPAMSAADGAARLSPSRVGFALDPRPLTHGQWLSLIFLAGAGVAGLGDLKLAGGVPVASAAIGWLVLSAARVGGLGVASGVGIALDLVPALFALGLGSALPFGGALGLAAGVLSAWKSWVMAAGYMGMALLLSLQEATPWLMAGQWLALGLGLVCFLLVPSEFYARLARMIPDTAEQRQAQVDRLHRAHRAFVAKLNQFAALFQDLAGTFSQSPPPPEDQQKGILQAVGVVQELMAGTCSHCKSVRYCWNERFYTTYASFLGLITAAEKKGQVAAADVPGQLRGRCSYLPRVVDGVNSYMARLNTCTEWADRLAESRAVVAGQLRGVADILQNLAQETRLDVLYLDGAEQQLWRFFRRSGLPMQQIVVTRGPHDRIQVDLVFPACQQGLQCPRLLIPALSRLLRLPLMQADLRCGMQSGEQSCSLRLLPQVQYAIQTARASRAQDGGLISGDACSRLDLGDGRVASILSDGMGTGPRASLQSSVTVNMLEQLLKAGLNRYFAVHTVNSLLLLRSSEEIFATVDLALLDRYTGLVEFVKIGSPPSYIKRGKEVAVVRGEAPPAGMLPDLEVDVSTRQLQHGDLLVMLTDGIYESVPRQEGQGADDWIPGFLSQLASDNPQEVADALLAAALQSQSGRSRDDMTVVVMRLAWWHEQPRQASPEPAPVARLQRREARRSAWPESPQEQALG